MSALVFLPPTHTSRRPKHEIKVGDLVTVNLHRDKECGARVIRIAYGDYFVRLAGLSIPEPYEIGMALVLPAEKVVDW